MPGEEAADESDPHSTDDESALPFDPLTDQTGDDQTEDEITELQVALLETHH